MKHLLAVVSCIGLAGCAVDCGSNWFDVGQNDGRIGADSQVENYARSCPGIDRARYAEGHQAGLGLRPRVSAF